MSEEKALKVQMAQLLENFDDFKNVVPTLEDLYYLLTMWAHFEMRIEVPTIADISPGELIYPERNLDTGILEEVYPILDGGTVLSTSKGEEMVNSSLSMKKMFRTIEKMVRIILERTDSDETDSGEGKNAPEVKIAFAGHEICKRKAFELIICLEENVIVTNFEPGLWGDQRLKTIEEMTKRGYGFPKDALLNK